MTVRRQRSQYHLAVAGGPVDCQLPIADCRLVSMNRRQLLIGAKIKSPIENRQSAIVGPTRYREVVLTSLPPRNAPGNRSTLFLRHTNRRLPKVVAISLRRSDYFILPAPDGETAYRSAVLQFEVGSSEFSL